MKKLALSLLVACLTFTTLAQTNTTNTVSIETNLPPSLPEHVSTWLTFLSATASNWYVAPYGIYVDETDEVGVGVAAMYSLSQYALTGLRLDVFGDTVFMPSITAQLQLPITVAGKVKVTPFAISGLATPLGDGENDQEGEAVGIFGAGLAVSVNKRFGFVYSAEAWTGMSGTQHRGGIYWKF